MRKFMDEDFLLRSTTASRLYHEYAADMPVFDYHNHLNPQEIYEDRVYDNIAAVWLGGDHYKWRAMRTYGIEEARITGDADPYDKFLAWAETVDHAMGNPLYHWTHLELQRYFDIHVPLCKENAGEIWNRCNEKLRTEAYSVRKLLQMQNVKALCTTDDPCDDLVWHKKLKAEFPEVKVLPSFRPDQAVHIEKAGFPAYIKRLEEVSGKGLGTLDKLEKVLLERLDYFVENGCLVSDHSLENAFDGAAAREEADWIYRTRIAGGEPDPAESARFKGYLLGFLGRAYHDRGIVMQLHIGALRNNSARMASRVGADAGFDSMNDFEMAEQVSRLLDAMDRSDQLPKTILYNLNPKDSATLACMAGNYQGGGIRGKVQFGPAWWFCDHKKGIEEHFDVLASLSLLSVSTGMLTDSRSFLSFPRHEYFRRIWSNKIGELIEQGEFPDDLEKAGGMLQDVCWNNAVRYFGL